MADSSSLGFRLETTWAPASAGEPLTYCLKLTNNSGKPVSAFTLCVSGPARIDPAATIEGARLIERLSNHSKFSPPEGFSLAQDETWTVNVRGLSYPLRHWSDGAMSAYLLLSDGSLAAVAVEPTAAIGNNEPHRKGAARFPVPANVPSPISVIPWPNAVSVSGRATVPAGLFFDAGSATAQSAAAAFAELSSRLFPAEGLARPRAEGGSPVACIDDDRLTAEAYRISFRQGQIELSASGHAGFLYGMITLGQILRGARHYPGQLTFPAEGTVSDAPAMRWRGSHLDVARQFYSSQEVSQFLAVLAWNKMNRFHWHLSDDEAWRVEIDAYPQLASVGAWRGQGLPIPALLGTGAAKTGGYYEKPAIRRIVALAQSYGIEIVPEIDVPGHCFAMLAAIPELRDPLETGNYASVQGFPNNCLNPALEETYQIIETVFDEMIALFPSRVFHIGADEVPLGAWSGSPAALKLLGEIAGPAAAKAHAARNGEITNLHGADEIGGSGAGALQALFLQRIQRFLASRGCVTGGWEEAALGDLIEKSKCYLVGWRNVAVSAELAGQGYDIVVSPGQAYYLDMSQSARWSEPGAGWAGWSGPQETYEFNPCKDWTSTQREHLLGIQACIWSEPMTDRAVFDRLVFPRLSAIAETGWTNGSGKSWERFSALAGLMPILYGNWEL